MIVEGDPDKLLGRLERSKLKKIGFWKDTSALTSLAKLTGFPIDTSLSFDGLPDPHDLVDPNWLDEKSRELVAIYLDAGKRVEQYMGCSFCRFNCGISSSEMGTADLSDGVYLWPEGLSHYIRRHHVRLPDEFLKHIAKMLRSAL